MTINEASEQYNIPISVLREYESWGLCDTVKTVMGVWQYPIWWGEAPRIVNTFLESYDFNGKTIAPFCTSASSPLGSSAAKLQDLTDSATWLEGQRFSGGASVSDVQSWVDSLNLNG